MNRGDYKIDAILDLYTLELVQALTTSCAERAISTLGQIKTKLRNRLNVNTVNDKMELFLNGPGQISAQRSCSSAHLYAEAFKLFMAEVKRNANMARFGQRARRSTDGSKPKTLMEALESAGDSEDEAFEELLAVASGAELPI
jgi:hypothetical protein